MSTASFVERLRAEMERQGLSVREMASRLACSPENVRQIFSRGKTMQISTAERLAGALGCALELRLVSTTAAAVEPSLRSYSKAPSGVGRLRGAGPESPETRRRPSS